MTELTEQEWVAQVYEPQVAAEQWLVHPAAAMFPLLDGHDFEELVESIRANGLREPVTVTVDGLLLDGRNRVAACYVAGVEVRTVVYDGDDPVGFSVDKNLKRRHLNTGQRGMLALRILAAYEAEAKQRQVEAGRTNGRGQKVPANLPEPIEGDRAERESRARAAAQVGVSARTVQMAKKIAAEDPRAAARVEDGTQTINAAYNSMEAILEARQKQAAIWAEAKADTDKARQSQPLVWALTGIDMHLDKILAEHLPLPDVGEVRPGDRRRLERTARTLAEITGTVNTYLVNINLEKKGSDQ